MSVCASLNLRREAERGINAQIMQGSAAAKTIAGNNVLQPNTGRCVVDAEGRLHMIITVLAAAMTLAMLVATVYALHSEAPSSGLLENSDSERGFGL